MESTSNVTILLFSLVANLTTDVPPDGALRSAATGAERTTPPGSSSTPLSGNATCAPPSRSPGAASLHGPQLLPDEAVFQGVHTVLTVLALAANCLSLMVIYGAVPRLTPPLRLLTSLAFADMLAPWAIMTLYFSRSACQVRSALSVRHESVG